MIKVAKAGGALVKGAVAGAKAAQGAEKALITGGTHGIGLAVGIALGFIVAFLAAVGKSDAKDMFYEAAEEPHMVDLLLPNAADVGTPT